MNNDRITRLFGLDGRIAVVTGGSRGIGYAISEGFVDAGAKVLVASRTSSSVNHAVQQLRARGGHATGVVADMANLADVRRIVDTAMDAYGGIDIVVNNAAIALSQPVGEFTEDAWAQVHDVNLRGPVFLVQAALECLTASPYASVINVISTGAFLAVPNSAMYAATKSALLAHTRTMAAQFASRGIRVNALAPGTVRTDMVTSSGPEAQQQNVMASHMKRMADPEEMFGPALFLASDASSFVTGQVVIADGGKVVAR